MPDTEIDGNDPQAHDQDRIVAFLQDPDTHDSQPVRRIDTHCSHVFLVGKHAYKLKRAVEFSYLDFSSPQKRKAACEAELRINRRTAPQLYQAVVPVTESRDGALSIDGAGNVVDWLVVMQRFDDDLLLSNLAERGELQIPMMQDLADAIAALHSGASSHHNRGGPDDFRTLLDGNALNLRKGVPTVLPAKKVKTLIEAAYARLAQDDAKLLGRAAAGFVRHGHGDLHLGNVTLIDGQPVLFDALEFNEALAIIDTYYDLAFLLMDLDERGFTNLANAVLNRYADRTVDWGGIGLLPAFMSCRAAIRAHVTAAEFAGEGEDEHQHDHEKIADARNYLDRAIEYLAPRKAQLIAIAGLSGSGKSVLAYNLAPEVGSAPGAVVLRSDVLRKQIFKADLFEKLPPEAYHEEITTKVYHRLLQQAEDILRQGHAVILDAVSLQSQQRSQMADIAAKAGVHFTGLWLDVSPEVQAHRLDRRQSDVSDADVKIGAQQRSIMHTPIEWSRIDANGTPAQTLTAARRMVKRS